MNDYANMIQGLPQGGDQSQYLAAMGLPQRAPGAGLNGQPNAPGQQQSMGLPRLPQGQPGPQGMPANGQGPQGNPFLQAIARLHAQRQGMPGQGMPGQPPGTPPGGQMQGRGPGQQGPFPGVQWGPQPLPQGMRGPGTMPPPAPPPWAGQNVQWGGPVQMRQPPGPLAQNGQGNGQ